MNTTILRETRKISIEDINNNYITGAELKKYINPTKPKEIIRVSNRDVYDKPLRSSTSLKNKTFHSSDVIFDEWYDDNKFEIDLVFGTLLGIYTSKKVEFYETHDELYTLFVKKYYRKVKRH